MGFETTRFEQISEDFQCSICQDILEDPLQISTCEHIFCTFCITQWTEHRSVCPVDNMPIIASQQLRETSRFFRNQYNRLRIKCKFNKYGCKEIVEIERIMNHQSNCTLNPDYKVECDKGCGVKLSKSDGSIHNCVIDLRNLMSELQTQLDTQAEQICAFRQIVMKNEMITNSCDELKDLIALLKRKRVLKSIRVANVMLAVDRSIFCASSPYNDDPQSIGYGTTISSPTMHATILELLHSKLTPTAKVLDIGSGSGYLTFCLALLVGSNGKVIGIDHVRQLVEQSNNKIKEHFPFLNKSQIKFVTGDGRSGYQSESPYDVINYGGAIGQVPQIVIDQLKPNGIILAPQGNAESQKLVTFEKSPSGIITIKEHMYVYFGRIMDLKSQV